MISIQPASPLGESDAPESNPKHPILLDKEMLIRRAFEEDPRKGFEFLYRQYYAPLCSHAIRYVYSKEQAEDIVGDIFFAFWQKELYKSIQISFQAYLYTCVRHHCLTYLKQEFARDLPVEALESASAFPSPEQTIQYEELYHRINTTIESLTPQVQKVFLMSRFEGKKNQVIARELQVSLKTVEAHMTRALSTLQKALRQDWTLLLLLFPLFSA